MLVDPKWPPGFFSLLYLNYYLSGAVCPCFRLSVCLSAKKTSYWLHISKNVSIKSCHIFKKNKNAILFSDFFGSDLSKMDQTCKFGEQTSRTLEFKPEGLDF